MTAGPEFHRPERIDTIGERPRAVFVTATAEECAALARRFGLIAIERLEGRFDLGRTGEAIVARGRVAAAVTQACIATGDPIEARIDEDVTLRFVAASPMTTATAEAEIELDARDCDTIAYDGQAIDLGEATAETMALALDPYPRGAGAEAALRAAGVKREDEAGPFGALAALKDRLSGGGSAV